MTTSNRSKPANILFIHSESMDGRLMGCMGHPSMQGVTPNMDRLARRGVLFRETYATCALCCPSRASMWTGKYPHYYDVWNNHEGLRDHIPTFFKVGEAAGYRMSNFGKLGFDYGKHSIRDRIGSWTRTAHVLRPINKLPLPMVLEEDAHPGDWRKAEQTIADLHQAAKDDKPFFCTVGTAMVHPMFLTNQNYLDRIDPDKIEIPPGLRDVDETDHPVDYYTRITKNHAKGMCPEMVREIRRVYFAMIAELDDLVGRILDTVDELGLADSTYIIFSSDHGDMAGEHNQVLKRSLYEPSIRVPLIIAGPGVRQGATVETPVSLIDIYPTLLDMAGLKYEDYATNTDWPEALDGESLMPQLTGDAPRQRAWAFAEHHGDRSPTGTYMIRRGPWKLLHHVDYDPQLFNLDQDPWEMHNVAAEEPAVLQELENLLHTNFDARGIELRVREYDRRSFLEWREKAKADGTYTATMGRVYSGFSRLCIDDFQPWTQADEQLLEDWLKRDISEPLPPMRRLKH